MDMALMVEAQGALLDNIEEMVASSSEYTEQGVKQLVVAKEYQKEARKKECVYMHVYVLSLRIFYPRFFIYFVTYRDVLHHRLSRDPHDDRHVLCFNFVAVLIFLFVLVHRCAASSPASRSS